MNQARAITLLTQASYVTIRPSEATAIIHELHALAPSDTGGYVYRETARAMEDAMVGRSRRRVVLGLMQEFALLRALERLPFGRTELRRLRDDLAHDTGAATAA